MLTRDDLNKIGEVVDKKMEKRFLEFGESIDKKVEKRFTEFGNEVDGKFENFGKIVDEKIEKQLKPVKEDIVHIRRDIKTMVNFFDREYLDLRKRVERIETRLKISVS